MLIKKKHVVVFSVLTGTNGALYLPRGHCATFLRILLSKKALKQTKAFDSWKIRSVA